MYYLQSRYYDPEICRFINADAQFDEDAGFCGYNLFTYCANNPVIHKDVTGEGIVLACVIIGAFIGAAYGAYKGAKVSEQELGYVDGYYVAAGVVIYGATGAIAGWAVGAAAAALGIGTTAGITGTLTPGLYSSWQQTEQAVRSMFDGISKAIPTQYGNRIIDCLSGRAAYEAKYGYTCLTKFVLKQIEKDIWLLTNGFVDSVEWHFFVSSVTGKGGASQSLIDALLNAGIKIVYH